MSPGPGAPGRPIPQARKPAHLVGDGADLGHRVRPEVQRPAQRDDPGPDLVCERRERVEIDGIVLGVHRGRVA